MTTTWVVTVDAGRDRPLHKLYICRVIPKFNKISDGTEEGARIRVACRNSSAR